ncbi:MAG TPA: hypothetical protein VIG73_14020 [Cerasibacillus sp.]|uniref:hypothetical protein n=1 Tax=Cerasibacillus sp. TaxID=2498711 RepID=UPI002F42B9C4
MIIPITGSVTYPITLDSSVWIFDDRKILLDEALRGVEQMGESEEEKLKRTVRGYDNDWYHHEHIKPPVNKSLSKKEREEALRHSWVMPLHHFIEYAEVKRDATEAELVTDDGSVDIPLSKLQKSYLLFAVDGKPVPEKGPVHLYYKDGSNKDNPIQGIKKIIIK